MRLDLTTLRPTAERLRQLVALFSGWGYTALCLEWGDGFPWTVDERFRGEGAYREELVAGIYRETANRGIAVNAIFPSPTSLDFVAKIPTYRHLFRWEASGPILDLRSPAGRKFHEDLIEDFLSLVPEPGKVMVDHPGEGSRPEDLRFIAEAFHERRIIVALRCRDRADLSDTSAEELSSLFDSVVIPLAASPSRAISNLPAGRVVHEARLFVEHERATVAKLLRDLRCAAEDCADRQPPALLVSFQPPDAFGKEGGGAGTLLASIELSLRDVRSFGRQAAEGIQIEPSAEETTPIAGEHTDSAAEAIDGAAAILALASELDKTLDAGWRWVRAIREHLAEYSSREACNPAYLRRAMKRLDERRGDAERLADVLYERLSPKIDSHALGLRLRGVVFPLFEEYHVLVPQIALSEPPFQTGAERGRA